MARLLGDGRGLHVRKGVSPPACLLTPEVAADYLGLDPRTVTRWARENYLPAHPLGEGKKKFWRFSLHELSEWLENQKNARDSE